MASYRDSEEQFWLRVVLHKADQCWRWIGAIDGHGYGRFHVMGLGTILAHRYIYAVEHDCWLPKGLVVRHSCDNPNCVNPRHLEGGTQRDNIQDMIRRGRARFGGKPFIPQEAAQ